MSNTLDQQDEANSPPAVVPTSVDSIVDGVDADTKPLKAQASLIKQEKVNSNVASAKRELSAAEGESFVGGQQPLSYRSMDTNQFLQYRQQSSVMFGIPSQFFESRASMRVWGADQLTDPAVQPIPKGAVLPKPFHVTIPGYKEEWCEDIIRKPGEKRIKEYRDPAFGPDLSDFPTWVPTFQPDPYFQKQPVGYNWDEQPQYKMDKFSYVNAFFTPKDPEETLMYNQMIPWCAYPYGVPAVDEYSNGDWGRFPKLLSSIVSMKDDDEKKNTTYCSDCCRKTSTLSGYESTKLSKQVTQTIRNENESIACPKSEGKSESKSKSSWFSSDCCRTQSSNGTKLDRDEVLSRTNTLMKSLSANLNNNLSRLQSQLSDAYAATKKKVSDASPTEIRVNS